MATLQENVKAMVAAGVPEEEIGNFIKTYGGGEKAKPQERGDWNWSPESMARGVGIGTGAAIKGVSGLADALITNPVNYISNALGAGSVLTPSREIPRALGLPQPENRQERLTSAAVEGGASALPFLGTGAALGGAASPVARAVGESLQAAPMLQGLSGASGNASAQLAAEAGGGPTAQVLSGLAGGFVPSVASATGAALRGGERLPVNSKLAERVYGAALKPSTTLTPEERTTALQAGIRERIVPSQKGMDKLSNLKGELADKVRAAIGAGEQPVNLDKILDQAADQAGRVHGNTVAPTSAKATIDNVLGDFVDTYGGEPMTTKRAQEVKQATYKALEDSYGDLTGPDKEARKALARGLKDEIAKNVPEVSDLNRRLGELSELTPIMEKAAARTQNWNPVGLGSLTGTGAGATVGGALGGGPGAALGAGLTMAGMQALRNPSNVARMAFGIDALRQARARASLGAIPIMNTQDALPLYFTRNRPAGGTDK